MEHAERSSIEKTTRGPMAETVSRRAASRVDLRPQAVAQQGLIHAMQGHGQPIVQRIPEAAAAPVHVTFNTQFHFSAAGATTSADALRITAARIAAGGWAGQYNHVAYDMNVTQLENFLYHKLVDDDFVTLANGHYQVTLNCNFWKVGPRAAPVAAQEARDCAIRIDPTNNMAAYHFEVL